MELAIVLAPVLIACVIMFVGAFVQTSIGFGLGIVTAPLLFYLDPHFIPGPITFAAMICCSINIWKFRSSLSLKGLYAALLGRIPGTFAGGFLLTLITPNILALMISSIIGFALLMVLCRFSIRATAVNMLIAGFFSGLMSTSTAIGGPPMALVMQNESTNAIRANLATFFFVGSMIQLPVLHYNGFFGSRELMLSLPLIPAALIGNFTAYRYCQRINPLMVRYATLTLCCIAVLSLLKETLFT